MAKTIMTRMVVMAVIVVLGVVVVRAAPMEDLVDGKMLPGWWKETPSRWWSGFLDINDSEKRLHYIFVEAERPSSHHDDVDDDEFFETAPSLLWLNGGPGCSSLEGFFYEHGPVIVADAHRPPNINFDGSPSSADDLNALVENQWSWSKAGANILYLESPAGVGFSYSTNRDELITGDNQTAYDNLLAMEQFFTVKFPELRYSSPFYVSGESYAGMYVPTLALKIYQSNNFPNFQGMLVGNGIFDWEDKASTIVPFAYGKGFLSTKSYHTIIETCGQSNDGYINPTPACQAQLQQIHTNMVDVNGYDAYRTCYHPHHHQTTPTTTGTTTSDDDVEDDKDSAAASAFGGGDSTSSMQPLWFSTMTPPLTLEDEGFSSTDGSASRKRHFDFFQNVHVTSTTKRLMEKHSSTTASFHSQSFRSQSSYSSNTGPVVVDGYVSVPCINSILGSKYLNNPKVREALHVEVSPNQWNVCGGVAYEHDGVFPSIIDVYKELITYSSSNPRILIYNGDVDTACNYLWAEASVSKFAGPIVELWRPWVYGSGDTVVGEQLGGFVTTYENTSFVTIHGAGHMSPQWRPEAVFTMLKSFLNHEPLPRKKKVAT